MRYVEGLVAEMIWQRSFNKLAQEKDVEDFIKKFEELILTFQRLISSLVL